MSPWRSVAVLVLFAAGGGAAMAVVYGSADGLRTGVLLAVTGTPVLLAAHLVARGRDRLGSLSRQFLAGVGLTAALSLVGVAALAAVLFVSPHDAFTLTLMLLFAGALATYAALPLARAAMHDLERVRDALRAVGEGRRGVRVQTRANDEIAELAAAGNEMVEQLEAHERERDSADAARRSLTAAVSHDLRTPLASLRVLAEAIEGEVVDDETRRRYVRQLGVHIAALGALVDDLFELSRLEAGDVQWSMQRVRLDELVEETLEAMRPQAAARGIATEARMAPDLPPARADPERLQRVLFNLIQNAIRHTPADGTITVAAGCAEGSVEVEVCDTGPGVAAEDRERIFEPFYRGGAGAARTGSGAGLGLAICRAIVEAHGGRIGLVASTRGTRIRFTVPRARWEGEG